MEKQCLKINGVSGGTHEKKVISRVGFGVAVVGEQTGSKGFRENARPPLRFGLWGLGGGRAILRSVHASLLPSFLPFRCRPAVTAITHSCDAAPLSHRDRHHGETQPSLYTLTCTGIYINPVHQRICYGLCNYRFLHQRSWLRTALAHFLRSAEWRTSLSRATPSSFLQPHRRRNTARLVRKREQPVYFFCSSRM